jgi:hypothetical protein
MWTDVPQNGEDLSYMFDGETETTPVKACGDLAYNVNNGGKNLWNSIFVHIVFQYIHNL